VLHWRASDQHLWTDAPVRIFDDGSVIDGTGLDVDMAEEAATVKGRVHASFAGGRGR
jgi:hypothetical protein